MSLTFKWKNLQSYLAEMTISFGFGFAVYSAIIGSTLTEQPSTPVIVGLTVALSSVALIYTFVDITIAHFNPAITFAAIVAGKIHILKGFGYILAQALGFMIAAAVVLGCFPGNVSDLLEIIRPKKVSSDVTTGELICTEMFLTGILVFVAFSVAINAYKKPVFKEDREFLINPEPVDTTPDKSILAPLVIGLTLGFLAFLGISSSGGVFNPGIVWAPVLFTGNWVNSWAYWVGEFVGGTAGGLLQVLFLYRVF
ncbi:aquaporin [Hamiltosporidium magnivora]|uniref:Aquaporin n=1 Tax=Hamiltosporidium magnivora TaxID=148818 RepID=A0A4V2JVY2_9MICR|nr:aquaporin [Hamiltosporidium magnivora]TBU05832.1 aquaporin [Hamiltosporidium magnivora]